MRDQSRRNKRIIKQRTLRSTAFCLAALVGFSGGLNALGIGLPGVAAVQAALTGMKSGKGYEDDIAEAEKAKQELENSKKEVEQRRNELAAEKSDLIKYIEQLDIELGKLYDEIDVLQEEIAQTQDDLTVTRDELVQAKQDVADQYEIMKRRIQYMYENGGNGDLLEAILSSESISDALNQVEYMMKITEYDNSLLERYEEAQLVVEETEKKLEAKLETLTAQEEELQVKKQAMEDLAADKATELARLTEELGIEEEMLFDYADQIAAKEIAIEDLKDKQEEWEAEQKRLEEERKRKEAEEAKRQAEAAAKAAEQNRGGSGNTTATGETSDATDLADIIWPVPGRPRISSYFGPRKAPTAGASTYHRGIDIDANTGDEIIAALAGTVTIASYSSSGGRYIQIDQGNGVKTRYLHCSKLLVSVGQEVKQGEVIALVGSTGISTGPHLHFSLSIDGVYVNPLTYVSYSN